MRAPDTIGSARRCPVLSGPMPAAQRRRNAVARRKAAAPSARCRLEHLQWFFQIVDGDVALDEIGSTRKIPRRLAVPSPNDQPGGGPHGTRLNSAPVGTRICAPQAGALTRSQFSRSWATLSGTKPPVVDCGFGELWNSAWAGPNNDAHAPGHRVEDLHGFAGNDAPLGDRALIAVLQAGNAGRGALPLGGTAPRPATPIFKELRIHLSSPMGGRRLRARSLSESLSSSLDILQQLLAGQLRSRSRIAALETSSRNFVIKVSTSPSVRHSGSRCAGFPARAAPISPISHCYIDAVGEQEFAGHR